VDSSATGAALVGIDFSAVALEQARARARRLGIMSSYKSATFDATGLDSASVDGAISIDVIWAIPDKRAGFAETARILKPGASFVFTDWERELSPAKILGHFAENQETPGLAGGEGGI